MWLLLCCLAHTCAVRKLRKLRKLMQIISNLRNTACVNVRVNCVNIMVSSILWLLRKIVLRCR